MFASSGNKYRRELNLGVILSLILLLQWQSTGATHHFESVDEGEYGKKRREDKKVRTKSIIGMNDVDVYDFE